MSGQHDQGGWSQSRYQRGVEKEKDDHLKTTCDALLRHFKRQPFQRLIVGGPREVVTDFEQKLHHYLSERLAGRIEVDVERSSPDQVLEAARPLIEKLEREREHDALERLGERGACGLEDVLPPLNERRVELLILDEQFGGVTGVQCLECGWLGLEGDRCPADGSETVQLEDLTEAMIELSRAAVGRPPGGAPRARGARAVRRRGRPAQVLSATIRERVKGPDFERTAMLKKLLFGAAAAGAVAWLSKNQDKAKAYADRYGGQLKGAAQNVTPGAGRAPAEERLNDPALVQKVESELFRDEHIHHVKGHIKFNAEYGVIYIRGEVPDEATREDITIAGAPRGRRARGREPDASPGRARPRQGRDALGRSHRSLRRFRLPPA